MSPYRRPFRWAHRHRHHIWGFLKLVGGVVVLVVASVALARANRVETARQATADANYAQCLRSIPFVQQVNEFIKGVETVADVLLINSEAMHAITEKGTPVYRQQTINIRRLRAAIVAGSGVRFPVPTEDVCSARREAELEGREP